MTAAHDIDDDRTHQDRDLIAPFVAWMATQELSEPVRRRNREAVEAFLLWRRTDDGPADGRRARYVDHVARNRPQDVADARTALELYAGYHFILRLTAVD